MSNNFYKLRIHLSDDPLQERDISNIKQLCHAIIKKCNLKLYTFGQETINTQGLPTGHHIHFHFEHWDTTANPHRNLVKWIRQQIPSLKGNKIWAMPPPEECNDLVRFLRYPLKEQGDRRLFACPPYVEFDYDTQEVLSKNERRDIIARNVAYAEKQENKNTLYQKMSAEILLDLSQNPVHVSVPLIFNKMVDYYVSESKPTCKRTINGYVSTFLIQNKYISSQTYTALNCENQNLPIIQKHAVLPQTPSTTQTPSPQLQTTPETKEG